MYILILMLALVVLLLVGSPVVLAIGVASIVYFFIKPGMIDSLSNYVHLLFAGMDSFVLVAIPLFVMAGEIMGKTKLTNRLINFCQLLTGRVRGGLAYVNVIVSMLFGGITGAALADISALGPMEIQLMKEDGYPPPFAAALTASSAIQGPIIPPSIPMILFASLTNVSVGAMFIGGLLPGIMLGVGQMVAILLLSKKRNFPKRENKYSNKEIFIIIKNSILPLLMPIIIVGGIVGGIFTPTEAAAVAVGYSLFVAIFVYRNLKLSDLLEILYNTALTTATIYLIIGFASVVSWIFAIEKLPNMILSIINEYNVSVYLLLFIVNIFLLFNGMWISDTAQIILFSSIFTPIFTRLGMNPVHFGVMMIVNVMIGMITPPYGTALYVVSAVSGENLRKIIKEIAPFMIVCIIVLFIITYVPAITLFLPRYFGLIR